MFSLAGHSGLSTVTGPASWGVAWRGGGSGGGGSGGSGGARGSGGGSGGGGGYRRKLRQWWRLRWSTWLRRW
jgi:hypothetical protein